ncbi:MAG: HK97 family phage prohead protease [Verrucomicrobiae bacterium]|nr:HK97 family phage prohead protease [Verrucomicrobiae bacterium]
MTQSPVEARTEGDQEIVSGYAAVYFDERDSGTEYVLWDEPGWGRCVERVRQGAYDRAAREDDVRALVNHEPSLLLGRNRAGTMRLKTDATGLHYECDVPRTNAGRDCLISIGRGDMTGSSYSFVPRKITWEEDNDAKLYVRWIEDVDLWDVGPVTFPAFEATSTQVGRSLILGDARDEFKHWRSVVKPPKRSYIREVDVRLRMIELEMGVAEPIV